jgi:hypothetical protein
MNQFSYNTYMHANVAMTEANRRRGPGTKEKVSLRRINLECNTYVQEHNASKLLV